MSVSVKQEPIVSFSDPPVVEVVASVEFSGLSDAAIFSVGTLWSEAFKEEFPNFSLQAPYDVPQERFHSPAPPSLDVQVSRHPRLPRLWLSGPEGSPGELMQIQQDWFALNWRKVGPQDAYDRWPRRRASFERYWRAFEGWASSRGEKLEPKQFEVTYINHVQPIEGLWATHADAAKVFSFGPPAVVDGCPLEQSAWSAEYVIRDGDSPRARTHVSVQPGFTAKQGASEPVPVLIFEVTARGLVRRGDNVLDCLDVGRNAVVRTFVEVSSDEAKRAWGVKSDD